MARKRMVTRTITLTKGEAMCLNIETAQVINLDYEVSGEFTNQPDKLLKEVKKRYETATIKVVAIQSERIAEEIYGMEEEDFIAHARIITR